ncbi:hypothetical protein ABPG74_018676 [Tetrahymena malaccensis]
MKKIIILSAILVLCQAQQYNYHIPDFPSSTIDSSCTWLKCNKELLAYSSKFPSTDPNFTPYYKLMICHTYMDNTVRQECFKATNNSNMPQEFQDLNSCELKNCYLHDWNTCRQQNQACKYCSDFKFCKNFQDSPDYQQADSVTGTCVTSKVAQSCSQFTDKNGFAFLVCQQYQQSLCRKEWIKANWDTTQFCQFCDIENFTNYNFSNYLTILVSSLFLFTLI